MLWRLRQDRHHRVPVDAIFSIHMRVAYCLQISRILVVYKKSYYERYQYERRERYLAALRQRQPQVVHTMQLSHEENQRTLAAVCTALSKRGLPYDCVYRGDLTSVDGYDVLLSVGGDGTFLEVAHYVSNIPILGVNSDPQRSTAFFCAANRGTIDERLTALLTGTLPEVRLARMQATLNAMPLPYLALNDILVAHANPAAVTSYTLHLSDAGEFHKSSGLWVATAAGSTAAIRSAGGSIMPLDSHHLQYLVREPYCGEGPRYTFLRGDIPPGAALRITSHMRRGRVFLDGPHLRFPFGLGDVLTLTTATTPLRAIGLDHTRRQRF